MPTNTVNYDADLSGLETAARQFITLMTLQGKAVDSLMIKQLEFNVQNDKARASLEANLSSGEKLTIGLRKQSGAWEATTGKVKESTSALTAQAKAAENFIKVNERAIKAAQEAAKNSGSGGDTGGGRPANLSPADFLRIAEATLFKSALTAIASEFKAAASAAKDFQIEVSLIRTVSQDANLGAQQWATGLKNVANILGTDVVDVSKAAYEAIQSQFVLTGPQTLEFLKEAGELARVLGTDIKKTADLMASVGQAFNLSITETGTIAAKLFKTVEVGRIKVDELVGALGRVGPSANAIGISFDEVNAAMATLTRQGIRTSDATTLVTNVILKLAKPTEAMTHLLRSWGFASGQAAIETLGFVGVLRKLEETTDGRLNELAAFFNELRGLKGAVGLTSAFGDFEKDIAKIKNSQDSYENAKAIRAESDADKIRRFQEVVKNTFVESYGQIALAFQEKFVPTLDKAESSTKIFTNAILATVVAGATLKAVTVANSIAYEAWFAAITRSTAAKQAQVVVDVNGTRVRLQSTAVTLANTEAEIARSIAIGKGVAAAEADIIAQNARNASLKTSAATQLAGSAAMTNAIGTTGLLTAAIIGLGLVYESVGEKAKTYYNEADGNFARLAENLRTLDAKKIQNTSQKNLDIFTDKTQGVFSIPLKGVAAAYIEANKQLEQLEKNSKGVAEAFGVSYKGYLDGLKSNITDLNKAISHSQTLIRESKNSLSGFSERLDDTIRKTQFKYAAADQKPQLLENSISRLSQQAEALYRAGDDQSVNRARSIFDDIAKLMEEKFDSEVDNTKKNLDNYFSNKRQVAQDRANGFFVNPNVTVDTAPLQGRFNQLLGRRNELESQYQRQQEAIVLAKQKQHALEEANLRKVEDAVKNFNAIDVFKNGKVNSDYIGKDNKLDKGKLEKDLQQKIDSIANLVPLEKRSYEFWRELYATKRSIAAQAEGQITKDTIEAEQNRLGQLEKLFIDRYKKAQDALGKISQDTFAPGGNADLLKENAKSIYSFSETRLGIGNRFLNFQDIDNIKRTVEGNRIRAAAGKALEDFNAAQEKLKSNATKVEGQLIPRKEDIDASEKALEKLELAVRAYFNSTNRGIDDSNFRSVTQPDKGGVTFGAVIDDTRKQLELLRKSGPDAEAQAKVIAQLNADLRDILTKGVSPLANKFPEFAAAGLDAANKVHDGFEQMKKDLKETIDLTERLGNQLKNLPQPPQIAPPNAPNNAFDNQDSDYFATGGYIHPGKARGTDTIPAWLSPGEFVINAAATRKFYTQLIDMNRGKAPKYFSQGGYVTNNIGDVHVHVSGGDVKNSANLARTIGHQLRREIRRGTVRTT